MNLMLTMVLGGLWHGASWNFVIWGGLHGVYLAAHKRFLASRHGHGRADGLILRTSSVGITFLLVLFTWLFFRSTSWDSTVLFFTKIINWEPSEYTALFVVITSTYLAVVFLLDALERYYGSHTYLLKVKHAGIRGGVLSAMFVVTLLYMYQAEPAPFLYFQF